MFRQSNLVLKAVNILIVQLNLVLNESEEYNHIHLITHCTYMSFAVNMEHYRKKSKKGSGILKKHVSIPVAAVVVKKVS